MGLCPVPKTLSTLHIDLHQFLLSILSTPRVLRIFSSPFRIVLAEIDLHSLPSRLRDRSLLQQPFNLIQSLGIPTSIR